MKKQPYITRLQNENAKLKEQLRVHEDRYSFVPHGVTPIDWTAEDAQWLQNMFHTEHGKKLRVTLNNWEYHYSFWALREPDPIKREEFQKQAIGMSLALNRLHWLAKCGRAVQGVDEIEPEFVNRGVGDLKPDEIEKHLDKMMSRPRMGSSRMMSL